MPIQIQCQGQSQFHRRHLPSSPLESFESNKKTQSVCEYWFYFKELTNRDLPKINRKIIVERDDPTVGYESSMNALSSDCTYRHMKNIDLSFYKIIINC